MQKIFTAILGTTLLAACNVYKPVTIRTRPVNGYEKNLGIVSYIPYETIPDEKEREIAEKKFLNSVIVAILDHSPPEARNDTIDSRTKFLLGRKEDSIIIVPDANNNNRFDDDTVIAVSSKILIPQSSVDLAGLPFVQIHNLHALYNGSQYSFSKKLFLLPDTTRTGHLSLTILSNEYSKGIFRHKGKKYAISARQISSGQFFTEDRYVNVRIDEMAKAPGKEYDENDILHIYDTIKTAGNIFVIQKISPFLDSIFLIPLSPGIFSSWTNKVKRKNSPDDINVFKDEPYPYLKYLFDSAHIHAAGNKVLLINFWFSKCIPCIAEFSALNKIQEKFGNDSLFKLASFTFESHEEIERVKKKYSLLFDISSLSREETDRLSLSRLYPTNIVLGRNGKVNEIFVGGETDPVQSSLFFERVIIPLLSSLIN